MAPKFKCLKNKNSSETILDFQTLCFKGIPLLKSLQSKYSDVIFMPGGGINESNLKEILEETRVKEFHASARSTQSSLMSHQNAKCKMGSDSTEYSIQVTDRDKVRTLMQIFNSIKIH